MSRQFVRIAVVVLGFSAFLVGFWLIQSDDAGVMDERMFVSTPGRSGGERESETLGNEPPSVSPVEESRQTFDAVKRLGGSAVVGTKGHILSINLTGCPVRGDDLEQLGPSPELTLLNLDNTPVQDDDLRRLHDLPKLKILRLSRTRIGDVGLQHLQNLPALSTLILNDSLVTDGGMKHLGGLPALSYIEAMGCPMSAQAQQVVHQIHPNCRLKH